MRVFTVLKPEANRQLNRHHDKIIGYKRMLFVIFALMYGPYFILITFS